MPAFSYVLPPFTFISPVAETIYIYTFYFFVLIIAYNLPNTELVNIPTLIVKKVPLTTSNYMVPRCFFPLIWTRQAVGTCIGTALFRSLLALASSQGASPTLTTGRLSPHELSLLDVSTVGAIMRIPMIFFFGINDYVINNSPYRLVQRSLLGITTF
jgi:hypothetical protein